MITDALLSLMAGFINGIVSLLPDWTMTLPPYLGDVVRWGNVLDVWAPIHESLTCALLYLTYVGGMFTWKMGIKVVDWIRG